MLQIRGDLLINCTFERAFLPFVAFANPFTSPREVTDAYISCYSAPESEVLPFVALPRRERVSRKLEEVWGFSGGGGGGEQEASVLQLADLGSVPVAFIFPSAFIAPFEGGPANKLRGLPPPPCPSCRVPGSGGRRAGVG